MICPKCEEGEIIKIRFLYNGTIAFLCRFCDTLWFDREHIDAITGHDFNAFSQDQDFEYTVEELAEKDQDHQPVRDPRIRN